jgi:hypothetical protein
MAVCRCETHAPHGTKRRYIHSVRPVRYPDTAIICGSLPCCEPGLIWLEQDPKRKPTEQKSEDESGRPRARVTELHNSTRLRLGSATPQ